jgi:hypothetical protein
MGELNDHPRRHSSYHRARRKIAIAWTIGIILLAVGLILALLGSAGRMVGGRRHYW